jgi:large conductance mechanosensitive channel
MPPIGMMTGGVDFGELAVELQAASGDVAAVTLNYGMFIQAVMDFVIVAFAIFMVIRAMNKMKKKEEEVPAEPAKPSAEVELLTEIRDSLKNN